MKSTSRTANIALDAHCVLVNLTYTFGIGILPACYYCNNTGDLGGIVNIMNKKKKNKSIC